MGGIRSEAHTPECDGQRHLSIKQKVFFLFFFWHLYIYLTVRGDSNQYSTRTPQSFPVFKRMLTNVTRLTATITLSY